MIRLFRYTIFGWLSACTGGKPAGDVVDTGDSFVLGTDTDIIGILKPMLAQSEQRFSKRIEELQRIAERGLETAAVQVAAQLDDSRWQQAPRCRGSADLTPLHIVEVPFTNPGSRFRYPNTRVMDVYTWRFTKSA